MQRKWRSQCIPKKALGLENESTSIDHIKYKYMIGSLLYFTTFRLDIMFNVWLWVNFQSNPTKVSCP